MMREAPSFALHFGSVFVFIIGDEKPPYTILLLRLLFLLHLLLRF
jgi:hypothetical protein